MLRIFFKQQQKVHHFIPCKSEASLYPVWCQSSYILRRSKNSKKSFNFIYLNSLKKVWRRGYLKNKSKWNKSPPVIFSTLSKKLRDSDLVQFFEDQIKNTFWDYSNFTVTQEVTKEFLVAASKNPTLKA